MENRRRQKGTSRKDREQCRVGLKEREMEGQDKTFNPQFEPIN